MNDSTTAPAAPLTFHFNALPFRAFADAQGTPWFILNDVCRILGYHKPRDALKLCRADGIAKHKICSEGSILLMNCVSDDSMYSLVIRSREPQAQAFERELMEKVLPTIRRAGRNTPPPPPLPSYARWVIQFD